MTSNRIAPSNMPIKIAILTHAKQKFEKTPYLLHILIGFWTKMGIEVVILRGIEHFEPADILFMHIDLTVIPDNYLAFSERYPVVINGRVRTISKRKISSNIITISDGYNGRVLVKTDLNFGGGMERRLARNKPVARLVDSIKKRLPWYLSGYLTPDNYPIYESPMEVPSAVWWNKNLVVEKFLPEREDDHYCLRQWVFMGKSEMSQKTVSSHPIVKASNIIRRETGIAIPDSLRQARADMGFDYGKFDFVMVEDQAVLLDANRTPSFNPNNASQTKMDLLKSLAAGLPSLVHIRPTVQAFINPDNKETIA